MCAGLVLRNRPDLLATEVEVFINGTKSKTWATYSGNNGELFYSNNNVVVLAADHGKKALPFLSNALHTVNLCFDLKMHQNVIYILYIQNFLTTSQTA